MVRPQLPANTSATPHWRPLALTLGIALVLLRMMLRLADWVLTNDAGHDDADAKVFATLWVLGGIGLSYWLHTRRLDRRWSGQLATLLMWLVYLVMVALLLWLLWPA